MNTETLKKLAEALGGVAQIHNGRVALVQVGALETKMLRWFDPENNAEQREEILLWLMRHHWTLTYDDDCGCYVFTPEGSEDSAILEKDYTTALLNAAEKEIN